MVIDTREHWRWPEVHWVNKELDWRAGGAITAGVDVGSISSKTAVMVDGKLYAYAILRTGASSPDSAVRATKKALEGTGLEIEKIHLTIGTGYGRINVPFAQKTLTEIACHARGANFVWGPTVRTVLDMGGQDCKAIQCDERGKVTSFLMNDKCAAGTGRGVEAFADLVKVPIEKIGEESFSIKEEPKPISNTCVIFAKSEALGLLRKGWDRNVVIASYLSAMAHRVYTLLERVGIAKDFVISGGIAKNPGVVRRLTTLTGIEPLAPNPQYDPQIVGAIGGALFAHAMLQKQKGAK
ncbi:MAG: benzoyl-CoA reductase, bzd-type, subunit Q [Planctomycetes bacterium]|nr:benzoyl-CoA reductase, bzd-type, subunit Q [Planctomycetota bacterium]